MSTPAPIPPPNDRRSSRASTASTQAEHADLRIVGGPPSSPSPLALRASHSPSAKRRRSRCLKLPPDMAALDYAAEPDANLLCLICHAPFSRPAQLPCEHIFCRDCLDHAWAPQPAAHKTCPTCRRHVESPQQLRPVPRIIETMLDELLVRCPHTHAGCTWLDHRVNLHDHVMLYCEHTPLECPAADCRLHTTQKDFHKGCLHYTVSCDDCHASLMRRDLEHHQRATCPNRTTACALCDAVLLRLDLKPHINNHCPKHVISCQGAIVGCTLRAERADIIQHETACPMAAMAPHFRDQQARIERNEARIEPLARKLGILEDGLANMTNMLYPNDSTADFPASFPHTQHDNPSNPSNPANANTTNEPPFDSQIHHLLTLHDNLRDEVSRIAHTLTQVEGRANMLIINESQRAKDEMLHTNAAINNMRMQLHWLMSATIHQRSTTASSSASRSAGAGAAQGGAARVQGRAGAGPATYRRLSDSTRQDTKL